MGKLYFQVAPRYTCGSPALVSEATARRVAAQEKEGYERALTGAYGEADRTLAETHGLAGIAYSTREIGREVEVTDLITAEVRRRPPSGTCPRCRQRVQAQGGRLVEHGASYSTYAFLSCDGTGTDVSRKVEL